MKDGTTSKTAGAAGFAALEVLAAGTLVAIILLSVATMFLTAYASIERSAKTSVSVALARQILEDLRSVPYESLTEFDGFDTTDSATLPDDDPEREIARRWRYAAAGEGEGFSYTAKEKGDWSSLGTKGAPITGSIEVSSPSGSLRLVTVTLIVAGKPGQIRLATLISRT